MKDEDKRALTVYGMILVVIVLCVLGRWRRAHDPELQSMYDCIQSCGKKHP